MSNEKTGGRAFPSTGPVSEYGMSLRDYFAAQVMPQVYAGSVQEFARSKMDGAVFAAHMAKCAYAMADAMLEARTAAQSSTDQQG